MTWCPPSLGRWQGGPRAAEGRGKRAAEVRRKSSERRTPMILAPPTRGAHRWHRSVRLHPPAHSPTEDAVKSLIRSVLLVLFSVVVVTAQEPMLVLEGGTLIDGRGGPPIEDAVVVVNGNRISAVGRRGQIPIPPGANVIQTTGRTILPGLIDMHLHLRGWKI